MIESESPQALRLLLVEDSENDALLNLKAFERAGHQVFHRRVDNGDDLRNALQNGSWHAIICDYAMPGFDGHSALVILRELDLDVPFLVVSGTIGEDIAVDMMRAGAHDYLLKDNLSRLVPATLREIAEARMRRERGRETADRIEAEKEAEFSRERLQLSQFMLENINEAAFMIDHDGLIRETNPAATRMLGYSAEQLQRLYVWDINAEYRPEDWPDLRDATRQAGRVIRQTRHRRKDGSILEVEVSINLFNYHGKDFHVSTVRDVSERKAAENAVRLSEQRFRTLAANAPVGILQTNNESHCVYVNDTWSRLAGQPPRLALGEGWSTAIHPDDRESVRERWIRDTADGKSFAIEFRMRTPEGTVNWVAASAVPLPDPDKSHRGYLATVMNITELKQREQQLVELARRMETIREEERKHIAREIHDELGQIMTVLKMNLIGVEDEILGLPASEERNRMEDDIVAATGMIDRTIVAVRQIAMRIRPSVLDQLGLAPALQQECEQFENRNEIRTRFLAPESMPILSDEAQTGLFRLSQEFLTNILRHAQASNVTVQLDHSPTHVYLEVQDDGEGFDPEEAQRRGHLGLLGARERAENLGGNVELITEPGKGTVVKVAVPIHRATAKEHEKDLDSR